jgi:hypothetical protein
MFDVGINSVTVGGEQELKERELLNTARGSAGWTGQPRG